MFTITRADPATVEVAMQARIDLPAVAVVGTDNGRIVATGGLAWGEGRCWLWFKSTEDRGRNAVAIVRSARRLLKCAVQLGETEVFTPRDVNEPRSAKLLTLVGFQFHGHEIVRGQDAEVWRWAHCST